MTAESDAEEDEESSGAVDYDYLLGMAMWNLTKEKKDELLKKEQEKIHELKIMQKKTPKDIWLYDLDFLLEEVRFLF